jgi:hypothetical protein
MELAASIQADYYPISTDGSLSGHPHADGIARLIVARNHHKELCFNYRTPMTSIWDRAEWRSKYNYDVRYGEGHQPLRNDLHKRSLSEAANDKGAAVTEILKGINVDSL